MELYETDDYSIFNKYKDNRDIAPTLVKRFEIALKQNNLTKFRPIMVNSKMEVIDGQHRLQAAKNLHIKIWYAVKQDFVETDLIDLNSIGEIWKFDDYFKYYIKKGFPEYLKLEKITIKYSLCHKTLISFIIDYKWKNFQKGEIKTVLDCYIDEIMSIFIVITAWIRKSFCTTDRMYIKNVRFTRTLIDFLGKEDVDHQIFFKKLQLKSDFLKNCATIGEYLKLFLKIYNYKNLNKIEFEE